MVGNEVMERCGCGAVLSRAVYPLADADAVLRQFRTEHRHIEPRPERVVVRIPRGAPRLRISRRLAAREFGGRRGDA